MTAGILDPTVLGYFTGAIFGAIVLVLAGSLIAVHLIVAAVRREVRSIRDSLAQVANDTDPVPNTLTGINQTLERLAGTLGSVARHINAARSIFDRFAQSA